MRHTAAFKVFLFCDNVVFGACVCLECCINFPPLFSPSDLSNNNKASAQWSQLTRHTNTLDSSSCVIFLCPLLVFGQKNVEGGGEGRALDSGGSERPSVIFNYGVDVDSSMDLFQSSSLLTDSGVSLPVTWNTSSTKDNMLWFITWLIFLSLR